MAKRHRLDLIGECYNAEAQRQVSPEEFKQLICDHCRQPRCTRAKWGYTHFDQRMETQVDRLLINPKFSDMTLPEHVQIADADWPDIKQKVERLIVSAARGDWAPVEQESAVVVAAERQFGLHEDVEEDASAASPEAQKAVDNAVRRLAQMRGKAIPDKKPEKPQRQAAESEPNPDDDMTEAERHRADRMDKEHGTNRVPPRKAPQPVQHPGVQPQNTQFSPMGGFIIDNRPGRQGTAKPPPEPPTDPWAPRQDRVMKKGENTVVIGGGDKDDDGPG